METIENPFDEIHRQLAERHERAVIDAILGIDWPKSTEDVLLEAHIASGCKPGESLIERCRELAAMEARLNAPLVVVNVTSEEAVRLRELAAKESCAPGTILSLPQTTTFFRSGAFIAAEEWCYVGADGKKQETWRDREPLL
jgi:hypothetical protein